MSTAEGTRVLVVDASKVARRLIQKTISQALPDLEVVCCATGDEALKELEAGDVALVTSSLALPDHDGVALAALMRERSEQRYMPIILVSGETNERLANRDISEDVTDYFDKSDGFKALGAFVRGYVKPDTSVTGHILYVEDSRVVAVATRRVMEGAGFSVRHVMSVEEALEIIADENDQPIDVVLTDVYLKGGLTGKELVTEVRGRMNLGRRRLPILVMTGDDNRENQAALLRAGANDLVAKPIDDDLLVRKLRFQLQLSQGKTE